MPTHVFMWSRNFLDNYWICEGEMLCRICKEYKRSTDKERKKKKILRISSVFSRVKK